MKKSILRLTGVLVVVPLLFSACTSLPTGPTAMALPGAGKTFDQFRLDDMDCREFAQRQISGAEKNQADTAVKSAVVGTMIGALAGAAIGGRNGAGAGAGTGLLMGSLAGSDTTHRMGYCAQRSYDHAYLQCMYAKGEQVPMPTSMTRRYDAPAMPPMPAPSVSTPPSGYPPPPPPGPPPAPPPSR